MSINCWKQFRKTQNNILKPFFPNKHHRRLKRFVLVVPNWETVAVTVQAQLHITCLTSDDLSGWPWPLLISIFMGLMRRKNSTNSWRANYWNVRPNILQPWFQICIDASPTNRVIVIGNVSRHQVYCQSHSKFLGCESLTSLCGFVNDKGIVYWSF